jgi:small conductance mechanosensitive channel
MDDLYAKAINWFNDFITYEMIFRFISSLVFAVLILIGSLFVLKFGNKIIDRLIEKQKTQSIRRRRTLMLLLKSIFRYTVYFVSGIIILSIFGVPVASLIAGAGIIGLAIGFGAQNLVRDIINGFFILFEDQFAVGDYIKAAGLEGIVEEIGVRTTNIRDFGGELHIIPNGEISQVTNYSSGNMRVMVDVGVSYDENPAEVIGILEELCQEIALEKAEIITDGPVVLGIQELASSSVVIRIWAKVKPMEQWAMGRYIRQRIKERFDERGIEIAYPHMVLLSKDSKEEINGKINETDI